jgi:hypothetical protein
MEKEDGDRKLLCLSALVCLPALVLFAYPRRRSLCIWFNLLGSAGAIVASGWPTF